MRRGRTVLFENVNLKVHPRQRLGLVGANGCGKSSLFAMLLGELDADEGELDVDPRSVIAHVAQQSPNGQRSAVDFVMDGDAEFREVETALSQNQASASLHERFDAIGGFTAEARASRLLHGLGFQSDEYTKSISEFSGGWRMRLNLAKALMCRSDILLLDEPTNHLDLPAILWLERWLLRYDGILMLVSHDRDFLDQVCTRVAHIERRSILTYSGNYSQFEARRAEQLAQQQSMYARQQKEVQHIQSYVDRFRYKASKARQAQSRLKMLKRMETIAPAHVDSPFQFQFPVPEKQPQHLLGLSDASVGYGQTTVLDRIDLHLSAGDRIGLLGVNGAGKSTLVKALSSGDTLLRGERVVSKDTRIGYFAQHQLDQLSTDQSPIDHLRRVAPNDREQDHRNYLGRFGFGGDRIFEPVAPFSGGEKARLVLALMIRTGPNLLLLDEPTNHLDLDMRQALSVALIEYSGALVVISHDRHLLRSVCDELLLVHEGGVTRFNKSLDDYPQWLREREQNGASVAGKVSSNPPRSRNRKLERQQQAALRRRLKPLSDRVKHIERELTLKRRALADCDARLADESMYTDKSRKHELERLVKEQASARNDIDSLEWDWLEASERLEGASQNEKEAND